MAKKRCINYWRSCPKVHISFNKNNKFKKKAARKKQEIIDQQKSEAITEKRWKNRGGINLLIEDHGYYDNKTFADLDQEDDFNLLKDD